MADYLEYWIGKNVNYDDIWQAYERGQAYVDKFRAMRVHLIQLRFANFTPDLPLFNHEAVYKTLKGYFHDMKYLCYPSTVYDSAGPLFLYGVQRGSGIWEFLGELRQLLLFGTTLADEKLIGQRLSNMDKRLEIRQKHFGATVTPEDFEAFAKAKTPRQLQRVFNKLIEQGIESVKISRKPFTGDVKEIEDSMTDIKGLLKEVDTSGEKSAS